MAAKSSFNSTETTCHGDYFHNPVFISSPLSDTLLANWVGLRIGMWSYSDNEVRGEVFQRYIGNSLHIVELNSVNPKSIFSQNLRMCFGNRVFADVYLVKDLQKNPTGFGVNLKSNDSCPYRKRRGHRYIQRADVSKQMLHWSKLKSQGRFH